MMNELNKLLMMFIKDGYSASGKISKKTALAMMKFVGGDKALQSHVNNSDWNSVLNHKQSEWVSVDDGDLVPNTYYLVQCDEGEWVPFLLNIYSQWVCNSNFLPVEIFSRLNKVLMPTPPNGPKS